MGEHLIDRCTIAGDHILVTAIDENRVIISLVLGTGRSLVGLVQSAAKEGEVEKAIDAACGAAVEHGWFSQLTKPDVSVGGTRLPASVPASNVSASVTGTYTSLLEGFDSDSEDDEGPIASALDTAKEYADHHGLEIKDSTFGLGLFAKNELRLEEKTSMFLMGDFEAWTPSEVLAEMKADGVPRFSVCDASIFRDSLLQDGEVAAEKTALYLKPAPECFLFYMNSSAPDPLRSNMVRKSVFEKDVPERGDARAVLSDADKGIEFWIDRALAKGEELLHFYPIFAPLADGDDDEDGGEGDGAGRASPSPRRSARRSMSFRSVAGGASSPSTGR